MYEYDFVRVDANWSGYSLFSGIKVDTGSYQAVIRERAAQGWRYVGYFPITGQDTLHELELVFERKVEESQ